MSLYEQAVGSMPIRIAAKAKSSSLSERDLPTSERENGWWVAYGSILVAYWSYCDHKESSISTAA